MLNVQKELITAKNAEELVKIANSKGNVRSLRIVHESKHSIIAHVEYQLTYDIVPTIGVPSKTSNWPDDSYFPKSDYNLGGFGPQTVCSVKQDNPWLELQKLAQDDELAEEFADVLDSMRSKDSKPLPDTGAVH